MIVVTGAIGIGKTTVCRKLIDMVRNWGFTCGGILTYKAVDKDIIIEDIQSGERETLAGTNNVYHGSRTAKYFFNPKGIELGIRAIDRGISSDILFADEIGHLELRGEGFANVPEVIRASKSKECILVVRKELLPAFLPWLHATPLVFETTISNRNQLPQDIGLMLLKKLTG